MAKNLKKENLKKLSQVTTSNGFKIDLANYIYNPSYEHDYPSLNKQIGETETEKQYMKVYYFKYYGGTGKYFMETYTSEKSKDGNMWTITKNNKKTELEASNRFSLKHLIELAEAIQELELVAK